MYFLAFIPTHFTQAVSRALHIYPLYYQYKLFPKNLVFFLFCALHYTSFYFNSLHYNLNDFHSILISLLWTFRWFPAHFTFLSLTSIITLLTLFLKIYVLQWRVPITSAHNCFQCWMILFANEYFPICVLCIIFLIFLSWSTLLR